MNSRVLLVIDAILFAAVCALLYLVLTTSAEVPLPPPDILSGDGTPAPAADETNFAVTFGNLGARDIFGVPIPIPPPPPPEEQPPPPPPNLDNILARLQMNACFGDEAEIQDTLDGSTHTIRVGELVSLIGDTPGVSVNLRVAGIDDQEFRVDFELDWPEYPTQQGSLLMFPE